MSKWHFVTDGFVKNNPTFVLVLGMCPTLATTTSAMNGLEMGLAALDASAGELVVTLAVASDQSDEPVLEYYGSYRLTGKYRKAVVVISVVKDLQYLHQSSSLYAVSRPIRIISSKAVRRSSAPRYSLRRMWSDTEQMASALLPAAAALR